MNDGKEVRRGTAEELADKNAAIPDNSGRLTVEIDNHEFVLSESAVQRSGYFRMIACGEFSKQTRTRLFRDPVSFGLVRKFLEGYPLHLEALSTQALSDLEADAEYYGIEALRKEIEDFRPAKSIRWLDRVREVWEGHHSRRTIVAERTTTILRDLMTVEISEFDPTLFEPDGRYRGMADEVIVILRNVPILRCGDSQYIVHFSAVKHHSASLFKQTRSSVDPGLIYVRFDNVPGDLSRLESICEESSDDDIPFLDCFIASKVFVRTWYSYLEGFQYQVIYMTLSPVLKILDNL